ncbi:MAG: type II secretion system protein [Candidatus Pacebacteria bacterium]|nr:type II secretion system protein [Candidatus Paceibacterota bacterium]
MNNKSQTGSGMIEILIATGVVGLVMTAVASGFVLSVKNSAISKYRVLSATRAQEAMEVFRREKVILGWSQFYETLTASTYCLDTLASNSAQFKEMVVGACDDDSVIAGTSFTREALVDITSPTEIRVEILVEWLDGDVLRSSNLIQEFKEYE